MLRSLLATTRYSSYFFPLKADTPFVKYANKRHVSDFKNFTIKPERLEQEVMPTQAEELSLTREIIGKVNEQITTQTYGRLFAVIYVLGRQHLVTTEDLLLIPGAFYPTTLDRIRFEKVLLVGGRDLTLMGRPILPKDLVRVEGTVVEKTLDSTIIRIKYKQGHKPTRMRRRPITVVRINRIDLDYPVDGLPSVEGVKGRVF